MDRRQQKTREAIYTAFRALLEKRRYSTITVQDIIDKANIGRSTFYAHFEEKDDLLRTMCAEIFDHIFADDIHEDHCTYSQKGNTDLQMMLTHILYHIKEDDLARIIKGECGNYFMDYFQKYIEDVFIKYNQVFHPKVPNDFLIGHLCASFSEAVRWWVNEDLHHTPEEVVAYYMAVTEKH